MRDLPSAVLAWAAAAAGVALALVAAQYPHESPKKAAAFLAVAAVVTVQLFAFAVTCYTSRFWLATLAASPPVSPDQPVPKIRRGIPTLKSNQSVAWGLDAWSFVVVLLVVLPVAVPLLTLYHPAGHLRPNERLGPISPTGLTHNAAGVAYTTSSYEAVDLAIHSKIDRYTQRIVVHDSADVHIMQDSRRVAVPSRVPQACEHDEVRAKNLKAVFGKYECVYLKAIEPPKGVRALNANTPDRVDLSVWRPNTTLPLGRAQWNITVALEKSPRLIDCGVTYQLAYPVKVVWRGKNTTDARLCHIDSMNYDNAKFYDYDSQNNATFIGLWNKPMDKLEVAFMNAYVHAIDVGNSGDMDNFVGAIFAATTIIRATSKNVNPGRDFTNEWPADQQYADVSTYDLRFSYGWSAVVLLLIIADVLLAVVATVLSSRQTPQHTAATNNKPLRGLCGSWSLRASAASGVVEGTTSSALASFNHSVGVPVPSQQQLGPGTPRAVGRAELYAADIQSSQAGSYSHQLPGHGPGAASHYP